MNKGKPKYDSKLSPSSVNRLESIRSKGDFKFWNKMKSIAEWRVNETRFGVVYDLKQRKEVFGGWSVHNGQVQPVRTEGK